MTQSALTSDEWRRKVGGPSVPSASEADGPIYLFELDKSGRLIVPDVQESFALDAAGQHALAALCLYEQPFGFTPEMVTALKQCIDDGERWRAQHGWSQPNGWRDAERKLAREAVERIAALLPPVP